jgi:hypothetical protein
MTRYRIDLSRVLTIRVPACCSTCPIGLTTGGGAKSCWIELPWQITILHRPAVNINALVFNVQHAGC